MSDKQFKHFIGIDVSKDKLDMVITCGKEMLHHQVIGNQTEAVLSYVSEVKKIDGFRLSSSVFGMEHTGIYNIPALRALRQVKAHIVLEDVTLMRSSLGKLRGKYDEIDAYRVARYLFKNRGELRLYEQRRSVIVKLSLLYSLRSRLLTHYHAMRVPLAESNKFMDREEVDLLNSLSSHSVSALKADLVKAEDALMTTVSSDARIQRLYEVITSVPGVGKITAVQIIITTNEFLDITDPKKFASYAGVAPFRRESGSVVGKARVSVFANREIKSLLHICAMSAVAHKSDLQAYYFRKTKIEGKPKMLALNAVRYKIILRVFACLSQDRLFEKEHKREKSHGD